MKASEADKKGEGLSRTGAMLPFLFILFTILQGSPVLQDTAVLPNSAVVQSIAVAEESSKKLPELESFLQGVRANLRSDRLLQSQYTYDLKQTKVHLDKEGHPKRYEVDEFEVFPSLDEEYTYVRQVVKDGQPLDPEKIEKQDRSHDKKLKKRAKELEKEGDDDRLQRLRGEAEEERKEDLIIDELFRLYEIALIRRDFIDGYSAILLEFYPRPDFKPSSREAKILAKLAGKAWFCEEDYQLIRSEVEFIDNVSFGKGLLARLHKGTKASIQRRRINEEVWMPAKAHVTGSARILLLKKIQINTINEYSNYRKFDVNASIDYSTSVQETEPAR
jgi:hypothetical protein